MAEQEFLASFGVEIDESGVERLQQALAQNRELAEALAAAFDRARLSVQAFFSELSEMSMPAPDFSAVRSAEETEGISIPLSLDLSESRKELDAFLEDAGEAFPLTADASGVVSAGQSALAQLQELYSATVLPLQVQEEIRHPELTGEEASAARVTEGYEGISVPFSLDFTKAAQELNAFFKSAKALRLSADASSIVSAGQNALSQLQSLFSSTVLPLKVQEEISPAESSGGEGSSGEGSAGSTGGSVHTENTSPVVSLTKAATGGRFTVPTKAEIAEDGDPEYVIPVKKETIAVPLLRQVFGELSESARETLQAGFSGQRETERKDALSGLPDLLSSASAAATPVINNNTSQNVSAPVSIQVTAPGTDPEAVGRSVYDVAEQYLLRTLESVMG